jgi:hypothetical protein
VIVPRKATQSATIVVEKVTSPANARLLLNQNPATDAVKKVMSHVNVPTKNLARVVVAAVVRPATPAAASVTCHATAPRARSATIVSLRQSS